MPNKADLTRNLNHSGVGPGSVMDEMAPGWPARRAA
jgi:hypothetical protein